MRYIRKRTVVEAKQFFKEKHSKYPYIGVYKDVSLKPFIITIHNQKAYLDEGDWIITESDGIHHYPCKPAIFDEIYEEEK